ncbi:hypothetical protein A4X13_0g2100 [Tilletia indica]|uniref:tRNA pseudouridine(55) synthase n=1 Tax=Tilletia indica TaxID=43049 RepID=A0A177TAV7_9BASI|nr:hypothetical protein A4X13_0g2100 [Tilletia indica]
MASSSSSSSSPSSSTSRRPLSGVFAIDKPSGPTSMALLEQLKPLFASSALFLNSDGSLPENRKPSKKDRRGRGGGGKWSRNAGRKGDPLPPKIGQGGTLDPLASGVLVIGVGDGTKKLQSYLDGAKEYLTVGLLGTSTTSYDALDPILYRAPHTHVSADTLAEQLPKFRGSILQAPPLYSAIRIDGMRLFEYARQGKELPRPIEKRKVEIKNLKLNAWYPSGSHSWKEPANEVPEEEKALVGKVRQLAGEVSAEAEPSKPDTVDDAPKATDEAPKATDGTDQSDPAAFGLTMSVGGGTYVRSIVHDLAQQAQSAAHVVALRRTRQGQWHTDRRLRARSSEVATDDWAEKEELIDVGPEDDDKSDLELVKGNCISWSVFERAIQKMHEGEGETKDGEEQPEEEGGPATKKRKVEDGSVSAEATQDGLQEWERILLEHIEAC